MGGPVVGDEQGQVDKEGGGVAAAFDLLSSEYGWTDEQILDLTLGRLLRCVRAVNARRTAEFRQQVRLTEEHARLIVNALAGLAQTKKAGQAIESFARKLSLLPPEERKPELPSTATVERLFGRRDR